MDYQMMNIDAWVPITHIKFFTFYDRVVVVCGLCTYMIPKSRVDHHQEKYVPWQHPGH